MTDNKLQMLKIMSVIYFFSEKFVYIYIYM